MSDSGTSGSGGIGFCGALCVLFVGLKLTHFIDWSWGWVLAPVWMPLSGAVVTGLVCGVFLLWCRRKDRRDERRSGRQYRALHERLRGR